jgi:hypothetical protein
MVWGTIEISNTINRQFADYMDKITVKSKKDIDSALSGKKVVLLLAGRQVFGDHRDEYDMEFYPGLEDDQIIPIFEGELSAKCYVSDATISDAAPLGFPGGTLVCESCKLNLIKE